MEKQSSFNPGGILKGVSPTISITPAPTPNKSSTGSVAPQKGKKSLSELEAEVADELAKAEAKRLQIESLRRDADEQNRKKKLSSLEECVQNAKRYDSWAKEEGSQLKPDREKVENYLHLAREAEKEANALRLELGLTQAESIVEDTEEKPSFWAQHYGKAWIVSLAFAITSIWSCYHFVMKYKAEIEAHNSVTTDSSLKIGSPYDESSIQGIIYDNLVQFTDIPKLWLFLLILTPPIFFYYLPFVKTKLNQWVDWQNVSPSTRLWLAFAYSALIFLASALYHLAGNGR